MRLGTLLAGLLAFWSLPATANDFQSIMSYKCTVSTDGQCAAKCARPPACASDCSKCTEDCRRNCQKIVWPDNGMNRLWETMSKAQRDQFLEGLMAHTTTGRDG